MAAGWRRGNDQDSRVKEREKERALLEMEISEKDGRGGGRGDNVCLGGEGYRQTVSTVVRF